MSAPEPSSINASLDERKPPISESANESDCYTEESDPTNEMSKTGSSNDDSVIKPNESFWMWEEVVTVEVGTRKIKFRVHKNLLSKTSDFFRAAFSSDWKESESNTLTLPSEDPNTFEILVNWLYFGQLIFPACYMIDERKTYWGLVKAYVLGDVIQSLDFKDTVIDEMISKNEPPGRERKSFCPGYGPIYYGYDHTITGDPLRRLLADMYAIAATSHWIQETSVENWHKDFLYDLSICLTTMKGEPPKSAIDKWPCRYHSHGEQQCDRLK